MTAFQCASPAHKGDRLIRDPWARYEKRIEYRRIRDAHSLTIYKLYNLCEDCVRIEAAEARNQQGQEALL